MPRNRPVPHHKWAKHKREAAPVCDCQNPVEGGGGAAGVSEGCEVHNNLSEADRRTQQWLRDLELDS